MKKIDIKKASKKMKKPVLVTVAVFLGILSFAQIGERILKVNAQLNDLTVLPFSLDYESVFPEEILDKEFEVSLSDSAIKNKKAIDYKVEVREKSSNNLCTFLETNNGENEGDTRDKSSLNMTDKNDSWQVRLDTPCIEGYVPLDEIGECKTIPSGGDYDCQIVVTATSAVAGVQDKDPEPKPKEKPQAIISRVLGAAVDTGLPVLMVLAASFVLSSMLYRKDRNGLKKLKN